MKKYVLLTLVYSAFVAITFFACKKSSFKDPNNEIENNLAAMEKSANEGFYFDFTLNPETPLAVEGQLSIADEIVNVKIDISDGIEMTDFLKISDEEIRFKNNGETLNYRILDRSENSTTLRFSTSTASRNFTVPFAFDFHGFDETGIPVTKEMAIACAPCWVVSGVVTVIGGAYCA